MVPVTTNFLLYFYASHYLEWCTLYILHLQLFCMRYYFLHLSCTVYLVWSQHTTVWNTVLWKIATLDSTSNKQNWIYQMQFFLRVYGCSGGQIPHLLWNPMIHDPVDYSPILDLILSQFTPLHISHPVFKMLLVHAFLCWEACQVESFRYSD
jgi:hypothetical protein